MLMTEVSGYIAHSRMFLLTFLFLHVLPVLEQGFRYIAQPPLFKMNKGRAEKYLMNEREFEEFFLSTWVETGRVKVPGKSAPLAEEPLLEVLKRLIEFRHLFSKFVKRGVPREIVDGLLRAKFRATKRGVGPEEIGAAIQSVGAEHKLKTFRVEVDEGENGEG